ncbi:hypothetical protein HanIR_Chr17g0873741 [Helianthus annuus]|nr:hypothetical protein HanIR_Chr17g0873741 [Helianthus annuus]
MCSFDPCFNKHNMIHATQKRKRKRYILTCSHIILHHILLMKQLPVVMEIRFSIRCFYFIIELAFRRRNRSVW